VTAKVKAVDPPRELAKSVILLIIHSAETLRKKKISDRKM
jgi:hypothetical protein